MVTEPCWSLAHPCLIPHESRSFGAGNEPLPSLTTAAMFTVRYINAEGVLPVLTQPHLCASFGFTFSPVTMSYHISRLTVRAQCCAEAQ